jgi:hypothetical protein
MRLEALHVATVRSLICCVVPCLVSAVNKAVKPRVVGASSVPGLLSMLQVMPLTQLATRLVTSQR